MSPRPRKASDDAIFAATWRAMQRLGPGELTLQAIAAEAGVTAGALVQRFGSRRALLLALSAAAAAAAAPMLEAHRARYRSPLAALRAWATGFAAMAATPDALARSLAWLQMDLTDPGFRPHLLAQQRATRSAINAMLREARRAGELAPRTDVRRLTHAVEAVSAGALLTWAIHGEGGAGPWVEQALDTILAPHRARRR